MTSFIIIVVIALFIVLVGFTWYRLEAYEGMEKVIICVAGILVSWLITSILFSISSNGIEYMNEEVKNEVSKILVLVFTPINGIAFMPILAKTMSRLKFDEIDSKEAVKQVFTLLAVFIIICVIEVMYLRNIQLGIFEVANGM